MAAALPGTKAGDGVSMDQEQLDVAVATIGDAGFTSAQTAMLKTLAQNFVFTTDQVAALLECFSMSSDKVCAPAPRTPPRCYCTLCLLALTAGGTG